MEKNYVYFFTRQDISAEQQLVQTAHVALKLGTRCIVEDANNTYFTVVGVRNLEALLAVREILNTFFFQHVGFVEPDLNNELTSIATFPIPESNRGVLMAFNLLKF